MDRFDPSASGSGRVQDTSAQMGRPEALRQVSIQGKTANVGKKKKGFSRFISILLHPGQWKGAFKSRAKGSTIAPQRYTPKPQQNEQSQKPQPTPILERTAQAVTTSNVPSIQTRPDIPTQTQPATLEAFSAQAKQGQYSSQDGSLDTQQALADLRSLSKQDLRPIAGNETFKQLPKQLQNLAKQVYAEKKVQEEIGKLETGSPEELQQLRTKLDSMFRNPKTRQPSETTHILLAEFDRQHQAAQKFSTTLSAQESLPEALQETFPDIRPDDKRSTKNPDIRTAVDEFNVLKSQSPDPTNVLNKNPEFKKQAVPKFSNILCETNSCAAAPGYPYHCNTVSMHSGNYVAAQGCIEGTAANFVSMLAHNDAPVSVSLVSKSELDAEIRKPTFTEEDASGNSTRIPGNANRRSVSIGPKNIGEQVEYNGIKVRLDDQLWLDNKNVRVDVLNIDGKPHYRVYDTSWADHSAGNPARLAALSVLVEQLRQEPAISDRKDNPTVVNCNAGVGRTGTFITVNNSTREYLDKGAINPDFDAAIVQARKTRNNFVQNPGQRETLKALYQDLPATLNPMISQAGLAVNGTPVSFGATPSQNTTITDIDETYANFEAVRPQSQPVAPQPVPKKPGSTVVTKASQFMQKYKSGGYNNLQDPWIAIKQDISTIYDSNELGQLKSKIQQYAMSNPAYAEAAESVDTLIDSQLESISGPGSAVDSFNRPTIRTRN